MTTRPLSPKAGYTAWILNPPAEQPSGFKDGTPVVVSSFAGGRVIVRSSEGRILNLPEEYLDCGYEFLLPTGIWAHESDARVLAELQALGGTVQDTPAETEFTALAHRVLERNAAILPLSSEAPQ